MYIALVFLALLPLTSCFSQSSEVDQPLVLVCILARNAAPTLPYFLGQLEELDYPKDKLRIYIRTDHNSDNTEEILRGWIDQVENIYESIDFKSDPTPVSYPGEKGPFDWTVERHRRIVDLKEVVLEKARNSEVEYLLFLDTDVFLTNTQVLRRLISDKKVVVAPMLKTSAMERSNFLVNTEGSGTERYFTIFQQRELGCFAVAAIHMALLINVKAKSSFALTFTPENLPSYGEKPLNDKLVFAQSANAANIELYILNTEFFGYALAFQPLSPHSVLEEQNRAMNEYLLNLMKEDFMPLLHSPFAKPIFPVINNQGLDQIYYINLDRRPERVTHMNAWLRAVGLNATRWPGFDGKLLTDNYIRSAGISFMPVYRSMYDQRLITVGEVGCFLSHLSIWQDMIKNGFQKVAILEDDIVFESFFRTQLHDVLFDIDQTGLEWDLIFLTRASYLKENITLLPGHRFLAKNIGYGSWTSAYLLSQTGARKLVKTQPWKNLLPVDEYLPIMYNQHFNASYKGYFPIRNLIAFTLKPLSVRPRKLYYDPDNVSDTDGTNCETLKIDKKKKSFHLKDEL